MANESFRIPRGILQLSRSSPPPGKNSACRACRIYKSSRVAAFVALLNMTNLANVIAEVAENRAGRGLKRGIIRLFDVIGSECTVRFWRCNLHLDKHLNVGPRESNSMK